MGLPQYPEKLIARSIVPMFRSPDPSSEQVSQALLGMRVVETGGRGDWCLIRTPDGYHGWCARAALCDPPLLWHGPWAEPDELWINLRNAPDSRAAAAFQATIGVRLPLVERRESEGWTGMLMPGGRCVWTESHRVLLTENGPDRSRTPTAICRTARRFLGVPYLWGGCSPLGLDCSGFVQLVLRLHGVEIQRDAGDQSAQGRSVVRPGRADLVFFGPPEPLTPITHVGMMLDADRFIHARGSGSVCINRLAEEPYTAMFRCLRRYL